MPGSKTQALTAIRARSAPLRAPSFSITRERCTSMVRGEMPRARPASLLAAPPTIFSSTSRSRCQESLIRDTRTGSVTRARLNFSDRRLAVEWRGELEVATLLGKLDALGFKAHPFD